MDWKGKLFAALFGLVTFVLVVSCLGIGAYWLWVNGPTPAQAAPPAPAEAPQLPTATPVSLSTLGIYCPEPKEVDQLLGVEIGTVVKVGTEVCAFTHRSFPDLTTFKCPRGEFIGQWVCTFDVSGDKVTHEGIDQSATVWGATWRYMPPYKGEDVCVIWQKEDLFGQDQDPRFDVRFQAVPGGVQQCS